MIARSFVVAIDGPAASGKGTLARRLAKRFGLAHLDTGGLYRATALLVLEAGADPADPASAAAAARRVDQRVLADPRLRGATVAANSSVVAAHPAVRHILLQFQRDFAAHPPPLAGGRAASGAVLDGRDIGTVVCPQADLKLFLTADVAVRAKRRAEELRARGAASIYEAVLQDLTERDARDSARRDAPLSVAPGAIIIDTTALDADAVLERVADITRRALDHARSGAA
ncbi:MAG TPA: (d)CMP kinase [Stellaceae bacterium]|nr:(d)CMP kinase [Stellaceae bacterium]